MIILKKLSELNEQDICVTLGNFDGVHLGHKSMLREIRKRKPNLKILLITFIPHPLKVIKKHNAFLVNSYEERRELLAKEGVDFLFEVPFNEIFSRLSPDEFVKNFLSSIQNLKYIFLGYDCTFGYGGQGDFAFLKSFFDGTPVNIELLEQFKFDDTYISSTQIRKHLAAGNIIQANRLLGRNYFIGGKVKKNYGRGKQIGFPTANIDYEKGLSLPFRGVYSTEFEIADKKYNSITNVGINPTFKDKKGISIETHILDFNQDIYEKKVKISFLLRLRDEKKFATIGGLIDQIRVDVQKRRSL